MTSKATFPIVRYYCATCGRWKWERHWDGCPANVSKAFTSHKPRR